MTSRGFGVWAKYGGTLIARPFARRQLFIGGVPGVIERTIVLCNKPSNGLCTQKKFHSLHNHRLQFFPPRVHRRREEWAAAFAGRDRFLGGMEATCNPGIRLFRILIIRSRRRGCAFATRTLARAALWVGAVGVDSDGDGHTHAQDQSPGNAGQ
jgi:hypothetical protein